MFSLEHSENILLSGLNLPLKILWVPKPVFSAPALYPACAEWDHPTVMDGIRSEIYFSLSLLQFVPIAK
jgi:hypothetical protein